MSMTIHCLQIATGYCGILVLAEAWKRMEVPSLRRVLLMVCEPRYFQDVARRRGNPSSLVHSRLLGADAKSWREESDNNDVASFFE